MNYKGGINMLKFHSAPNIFVTEIHLKVQDIERALEFYQDIMGLKVLKSEERLAVLSADGVTPLVTIEQPIDVISKLPKRTGLYHFAILLPTRASLGLFLKHIIKRKYPIIGGSNHGVSEAIYLQDPDDNGIEVYADTDLATWNWHNDSVEMVNSPIDYEEIIAESGDLEWEGIPSESIMGHIHLHVADLDESKIFYNKGLGFDLIQEMQNTAVFTSTGGYHHHIGFNIWNGKGAKALPDNSVGMKYYSLLFPDEKSRTKVIEKLSTLGFPAIHKEDKIFVKDPSENLIEFQVNIAK